MVSVTVSGLGMTIKYLKGVEKRMTKEVPLTSFRVAQRSKLRLREELQKLRRPDHKPSKHNTTRPLHSFYRIKKGGKGEYDLMPMGFGKRLASWVIDGTKPHYQPNHWWFKDHIHPGAGSQGPRSRNFLDNTAKTVLKKDVGPIIERTADRIIGR